MESFYKGKCKLCGKGIEIRVSIYDFSFIVYLMSSGDKFEIINAGNFKAGFDLYCKECWDKRGKNEKV